MKSLFSTPKRAIISGICMVVVIGAVSVMAVKSTLITKAEAKAAALSDAGLSEAEASALRVRLEFDDGRFQYEVDFYNNGTTYEYLIQAKDGDIIARDIEGGPNGTNYEQNLLSDAGNPPAVKEGNNALQQEQEGEGNQSAEGGTGAAPQQEEPVEQPADDGSRTASQQEEPGQQPADDRSRTAQQEVVGGQSPADGNRTAQSQGNSLDEAKAAALRDAGLSESDVTFKKAKLDRDKGIQVYEIEFYTSDTEYDYTLNASDLTVLEKSAELFQVQGNRTDSAANGSGNNYIGVDRAKEIALNHANLSETDVVFTKAKLENDDHRVEYEIEFYVGRTEYEYSIDAVSGNIIEYDVDYD